MIDKFKKAIQEASDLLRDQVGALGDSARDNSFKIIEDWLQIFPALELYGLKITSFALSVAINPALEVELKGEHEQFPTDRLNEILQECKGSTGLTSVFSTIKTTYGLHRRTAASIRDPLIVKVRIRLSPEIKVYIGEPIID